jgi:Spy/CpxP family protein refolding chaperone
MSSLIESRTPAHRPLATPWSQRVRRALRGGLVALSLATAATSAVACTSASPGAVTAAEHRGVAGALQVAIDEVDLDAKQREEASALIEEVRAKLEPARAERRRVAGEIADKIAQGTLTRADSDAAVGALVKVEASAAPALQDTANRLHGLLDADQREELLDAVRSTWRERWHSEGGPKTELKRLAKELDLTDAQRDAIKEKVKAELEREKPALRAKMESARDRLKAAADAFESDSFDAAALDLAKDGLSMRRSFLSVMLRVVEASLPTLTPAQRAKLAEFVRSRADMMN